MLPESLRAYLKAHPDLKADEAREALRLACRTSTYFLARVLGFDKLTPQTHTALCQFVDSDPHRGLILAPRSTFKSTIATITNLVRVILGDPDIRILLVSISQGNTTNLLSVVKAAFQGNTTLQWLFPECIPDFAKTTRWNQTEMCVKRTRDWPEATVEAVGTSSTVVSRHYDRIVNDDLVDEATANSPAELERALRFYKLEESLLVNPRAGQILTVGTRWAFHDPYQWILDHEAGVEVFHRGTRNPDGTLYFPEQLPQEELDRLRQKYGTWLYSALYENTPVDPEGNSFREEWLRHHRVEGDTIVYPQSRVPLAACRRFMRVDPAISEARTAARTAIVVDAVTPDDRKPLLDVWMQRCQPSEMFDVIFRLQDQWDCDAIGIESVAYQRALKPFLEAEALRRNRWLNVIELRPDTRKSKEARIRACQPYLERGEVSVDPAAHQAWLDEYRTFPTGTTVDGLDAWAYGPFMWETPLEDVDEDAEREHWMQDEGRSALTGY